MPFLSPIFKSNSLLDVPQPLFPDLIVTPSGKLILAYIEFDFGVSKIALLEKNVNTNWNITRNYDANQDKGQNVVGEIDLHYWNNNVVLSYVYQDGETNSLEIIKRPSDESPWEQFYVYNSTKTVSNVKISSKTNEYLWLSWIENNNSIKQSYYRIFNQTSSEWTNKTCLSENETHHTEYLVFATDLYNNGYFVWSEGTVNARQVFFRKTYSNETLGPIISLTSGIYDCIESTILVEADNTTHVMWSNYTDPYAGENKGTINIGYRKMNTNGDWSEEELVAPYTSHFKPGESDAFMPSFVIDGMNTMWLAFAARDDHYLHQGINLRTRISGIWQEEERVSQALNAALEPQLVCDAQNNIHCVWIDYRTAYAQLYYRTKSVLGFWSEELLLTFYVSESDIGYKWVFYVLGIITAFAAPLIIISQIRNRRRKKILSDRRKQLEN